MITKSKAKAFAEAVIKLRNSATDEQAIEVPVLYPTWKEDTSYKTGMRLTYNDTLYKVLQDHTSQSSWTPH